MKLAGSEVIRALDAAAINEAGIPGLVLMENAGRATVDCMVKHYGSMAGRRLVVFCGPGNNGGDGFVISRLLFESGAEVAVVLLCTPETLKGDAALNYSRARELAIPFTVFGENFGDTNIEQLVSGADFVVDALFGTGLKRELTGRYAEMVELINAAAVQTVAVDIPSGLDSDSGQPLGICVAAELTVTFALVKPGLLLYPGRQYTGILKVVDIGIPLEFVERASLTMTGLEAAEIRPWLPVRKNDTHKGTYGHLLVLAGSTGKTGAALLCGRGALRSGAGLVTMCVPKELNQVFEISLWEAMTVPLANVIDGKVGAQDYPVIERALAGKQAMVVGPGLGVEHGTADVVGRLYREAVIPMVVDADALNILAHCPKLLKEHCAPRILTPHPGEMSRLLGCSSVEVQRDRVGAAVGCARMSNAVVVLKGASTVIADHEGNVAINTTGNPGMAAGGMGDVLAGVIGSLIAQGSPSWHAACLGVFVHGLAADRLAARQGIRFGYLAGEVADELPGAFGTL